MSSRSQKLLALAKRLENLINPGRDPNKFPRDRDKTVDENVPVVPHTYPGTLTETMGGPAMKRHRPHQYEGPRGLADVEDEEE